jgi:hypothetical protein
MLLFSFVASKIADTLPVFFFFIVCYPMWSNYSETGMSNSLQHLDYDYVLHIVNFVILHEIQKS